MKQLTEKQSKALQIIAGLAAGIGIWLAIMFGAESDNVVLQYLFIVIFVVVILIQRKIERTYDVQLRLFTRFWLIGLAAGLVFFLIYGSMTGKLFQQ